MRRFLQRIWHFSEKISMLNSLRSLVFNYRDRVDSKIRSRMASMTEMASPRFGSEVPAPFPVDKESAFREEIIGLERSVGIEDPLFKRWFNTRIALSNYSWDLFSRLCFEIYASDNNVQEKPEIDETGLVLGSYSADLNERMREAFLSLHEVPFETQAADHHFYDISPGKPDQFNHMLKCYRPSTEICALVEELLSAFRTQIEQASGHYFSVSSFRVFSHLPDSSRPDDLEQLPRHLDRWPLAMKKLFILPWATSKELGTTLFKLKNGETTLVEQPGAGWALFENSCVWHCAIPPETEPRHTIELSLVPALKTDCRLTDTGMNASYPWYPMDRDLPFEEAIPEAFNMSAVDYRAMRRTLALMQSQMPPDHTGHVSRLIDNT